MHHIKPYFTPSHSIPVLSAQFHLVLSLSNPSRKAPFVSKPLRHPSLRRMSPHSNLVHKTPLHSEKILSFRRRGIHSLPKHTETIYCFTIHHIPIHATTLHSYPSSPTTFYCFPFCQRRLVSIPNLSGTLCCTIFHPIPLTLTLTQTHRHSHSPATSLTHSRNHTQKHPHTL